MDTTELNLKKILYIEDDPLLSKLLKKKLLPFSCTVDVAVNGKEGLTRLQKEKFHVVLLDYLLPFANGLEVLEELASYKREVPPVVFVTGMGDEAVAVKALKLGAADYLIKDVEGRYLDLLPSILCRVLQQRRVEDRNKIVEEQLRKLSSVVEQSPGVVIITDSEGRIEYVNPLFTSVTGYTFEEVLGKNPSILKSGDSDAEVYNRLWNTILSGGVWRGVFHNRKKNGEMYWGAACISPLRDSEGNITHFIGVQEDITKRKEAEKALVVALEQAEASSRSKTEFLQNMSHDLRTPLNGILGYTQILKRDKTLSLEHAHEVEIIEQCGEHLLTLINDILDLSRIEGGNIELIEEEFNLPDFLYTIVEIMEVSAKKKGISFMYDVSNVPKKVKGEQTRLRQILINLLSNAIKYTEQGRVSLRVNKRGEKIRFEVEDTGVGIDKDDLLEIFLPFHQVGEKKEYIEGAGLGLSICKKLITLMHSELHVRSQVQKGTCFWFDLGLNTKVTHDEKTEVPQSQEAPFEGKKIRILVVDDSKGNLCLLQEVLCQWGFGVYVAETGEVAVTLANEKKPDLVLMDIKMMGMDGYEAAQLMRTNEELRDMVIIAVSAMAFESDKKHALEAGFDDYITKPVRQAELLTVLNRHLLQSGASTEMERDEAEVLKQEAFICPEQNDQDTLLEFAKRGDVSEIMNWADMIEKSDKKYLRFVQEVREFANTFHIEEIIKMVEKK